MITTFDSKQLKKDLNNLVEYSIGFLDGVHGGKKLFLNNLGMQTVQTMKNFIDSNARVNPQMLHHIYEWNQIGNPDARLYNISYTTSNLGLSFKSSFSQSISIKNGSKVPFYDKARIMEYGIPVTIKPKKGKVLAFDQNGETIFTTNPVEVQDPGGTEVQGGFEKIFDTFFNSYFSQAFLKTSGIAQYLENPEVYKNNFKSGKTGGKSLGFTTGYRWIANAGVTA
jgi:hypothetical protein